jgi:hypothetical protein
MSVSFVCVCVCVCECVCVCMCVCAPQQILLLLLGFRENSIPIQYTIFPTGSIAKDIHIE